MPTIPIVPATTQPVPFAVVPSTVTEPKLIAAYAEWDGTSASGPFLPCLAIYSDAGVRLGRMFPSSTVAAGDSAVVTYAPFPGGLVQKAAPATAGLGDYVAADTKAPQQTIPDGGTGTAVVFNDGVQGGGAGSVTLNADLTTINMVHPGQYDISANILWVGTSTAGVRGALLQLATNNLDNAIDTLQTQVAENPATASALACLYHWTGAFTANGAVQIGALVNGAGSGVNIDYAQVTVTMTAPLGA